ncbi:MAG: TonB-dependent receptor [Acidobacteriota bacterium]|nr:TonB-dependent receptor [Blastocatellia bacterium]MDW8239828.1 TonB-dependent receptor [Acidobacteriota bacterium]
MRTRISEWMSVVLVIPLLTVTVFGQSRAELRGRIQDEAGAVIVGASVRLSTRGGDLRWSTVSDQSGSYQFSGLRVGDYLLEVRKPGFRPSVLTVQVESQAQSVDVTLQVAGLREEVVVTPSGRPQAPDEVSKSITVLSESEIEQRDEYSLVEALRNTPGLRVQQLAGPGGFATLQFRGLRSADSALLIDQLRLRDAADVNGSINGYLQDLLIDGYEQVEVLRGSASSLYGTNAIGGTINLVPRQGGGPAHGDLLMEGGSLRFGRVRGTLSGGLTRDRFLYSLGATHVNVADGVDGNDAYRNTTLNGRGQFLLRPDVSLTGRVLYSDAFGQLNETPFPRPGLAPLPTGQRIYRAVPLGEEGATFVYDLDDPDSRRDLSLFVGAVRFTHLVNPRWSYTVAYQGTDSRRQNADGPGQNPFLTGLSLSDSVRRAQFDSTIHNVETRHDIHLGRIMRLTLGYEFEQEQYLNTNLPNIVVDVTQRTQGFFLHNQFGLLARRLQFGAAFRVQGFDLETPSFTPATRSPYAGRLGQLDIPTAVTGDGSVSYFFERTGTKLRAHVGNGFSAPSIFERFGSSFFFGSFSFFGDPTLRPERSISVDVGVDQHLMNQRARLSATYFYTRLQEVIVFVNSFSPTDPKGFNRFFGYANGLGGLARGVEVSASISPIRSLDIFAAYTYTNSDEVAPNAAGTTRVFGLPDHQFSIQLNQRLRRFNINFDLTAFSNHDFPLFAPFRPFSSGVFRFQGYAKADLTVSYPIALSERLRLQLFGKIENLFDDDYFEEGFRAPGAVGLGGIRFQF